MSEHAEVLLNAPQNQDPGTIIGNIKQCVGRCALTISIALGGGVALGTAESVFEHPKPARAEATFSNDYPDQNAMDHRPSLSEWWKDENGNGQKNITDNNYTDNDETMSSRGYYYRNCTDGVAYWAAKYTGYHPANWGNANNWDSASQTTQKTVKAGNSNSIEPGDIAQSDDGSVGHVGFVTSVAKNPAGAVTSVTVAELNKAGNGLFTHDPYSQRNAAGKLVRHGSYDWDHFIDINGAGKGLGNEPWPSGGGATPPPPDPLALSLVRLNHPSGKVEVVSYSEIGRAHV